MTRLERIEKVRELCEKIHDLEADLWDTVSGDDSLYEIAEDHFSSFSPLEGDFDDFLAEVHGRGLL